MPAETIANRKASRSPLARAFEIDGSSIYGNRPHFKVKGPGGVATNLQEISWTNEISVPKDADLAGVLSAPDVKSDIPIVGSISASKFISYVSLANAAMQSSEE